MTPNVNPKLANERALENGMARNFKFTATPKTCSILNEMTVMKEGSRWERLGASTPQEVPHLWTSLEAPNIDPDLMEIIKIAPLA